MPVAQACPVTVTGAIRRVLTRRARGHKTPYRDKIRAQIVLLAARRWSNTAIAAEVGVVDDGTAPPLADPVAEHVPTARPGHRAPHL